MDPAARSILFTAQTHRKAQTCAEACRVIIRNYNKLSTKPPTINAQSVELVRQIITKMKKDGLLNKAEGATLTPVFIKKAEKAASETFGHLDKLLHKMIGRHVLEEPKREEKIKLTTEQKKQIAAANEFLRQAIPALRAATNEGQLQND